jgi:hypothetical protein
VAIECELERDPVPGDGVAATRAQGLENGGPAQLPRLHCRQSFAIGARVAQVIVGGSNDAEPVALGEKVLPGVPCPATGFSMADVREGRAVVLGVAPFRVDLKHRRNRGIQKSDVGAPVALPASRVVRDQQTSSPAGELLPAAQIVKQLELGIEVGEENVVIAQTGRVTLVAQNGDEAPRRIELARHSHDLGPARSRDGKAVDPLVFNGVFVMADVVPVGVRREGEEIQVLAGDLEGPSQGALRVADQIVVVQIPPVSSVG